MAAQEFDADFFEFPDGTVTAVIRSTWPWTDDVVEVLCPSARRAPKRVDALCERVGKGERAP